MATAKSQAKHCATCTYLRSATISVMDSLNLLRYRETPSIREVLVYTNKYTSTALEENALDS